MANHDVYADIGVIGGSGFYSFLEDVTEVTVDTPYGSPSDSLFLGAIGGRQVAFLPGTAAATPSRRTGSTTARTSGPCAPSAYDRSSGPAPSADCARTTDPARSSSPTSSSTVRRAGRRPTSTGSGAPTGPSPASST